MLLFNDLRHFTIFLTALCTAVLSGCKTTTLVEEVTDLQQVDSIEIINFWNGQNPNARFGQEFLLRRGENSFTGKARFVEAGNSKPPREITGDVEIPLEPIRSFLKKIAASPFSEVLYNHETNFIEALPSIRIKLAMNGEPPVVFTYLQRRESDLWHLEFKGKTFVVESDIPSAALAELEPYLKQKTPLGGIIENLRMPLPCAQNHFQTSKLPKQTPAGVEMSYRKSGGLLGTYKDFRVEDDDLWIEELKDKEQNPEIRTEKISVEEKDKLYRAFVDNKFDLITNDKPEGVFSDAGSESVSIKFGADSYEVSSSMNSPLSGINRTCFQNVADAFTILVSEHPPKPETDSEKFAVLSFNPEYDSWLFSNAEPAELDETEIAVIQDLLKKAVNEYNAAPVVPQKIDLSEYNYQIVPVITEEGEKHAWVNCFCVQSANWRKNVFRVRNDGGKCFFNLKINLTERKHYDFSVNGSS